MLGLPMLGTQICSLFSSGYFIQVEFGHLHHLSVSSGTVTSSLGLPHSHSNQAPSLGDSNGCDSPVKRHKDLPCPRLRGVFGLVFAARAALLLHAETMPSDQRWWLQCFQGTTGWWLLPQAHAVLPEMMGRMVAA